MAHGARSSPSSVILAARLVPFDSSAFSVVGRSLAHRVGGSSLLPSFGYFSAIAQDHASPLQLKLQLPKNVRQQEQTTRNDSSLQRGNKKKLQKKTRKNKLQTEAGQSSHGLLNGFLVLQLGPLGPWPLGPWPIGLSTARPLGCRPLGTSPPRPSALRPLGHSAPWSLG